MKYKSKSVEIEAVRWGHYFDFDEKMVEDANWIAAWVNANGGDARYEPVIVRGNAAGLNPRIAVRTVNGWVYAYPGHYIVKGTATFNVEQPQKDPRCGDHNLPYCEHCPDDYEHRMLTDFYPCDPETFEKRWEPA